jgi:hypothetical protein
MSIQEIQTSLLYKDKIPCRNYNEDDNDTFIGCCKTQIWDNLRPRISCKIAGFENLMVRGTAPRFTAEILKCRNFKMPNDKMPNDEMSILD